MVVYNINTHPLLVANNEVHKRLIIDGTETKVQEFA